jgi:hypothetical protein
MDDREMLRCNVVADRLFVWTVSLFALAALSQIFLAGYAALLAPGSLERACRLGPRISMAQRGIASRGLFQRSADLVRAV